MARLTAKARKALPDKDFAGPGRTYPVEDRAHAKAAILDGAKGRVKARAEAKLKATNKKGK